MISVIVVTHGRKCLLKDCVLSILDNSKGISFELIVVDNASDDGTADFLRSLGSTVRIISLTKPVHLNVAKEIGAAKAAGNYLAFTDDDCLVAQDWLRAINISLESYDVVAGIVAPVKKVELPFWWRKSMEWIIGVNISQSPNYFVLGSNLAYRKDAFYPLNAMGRFRNISVDASIYGEDTARVRVAVSHGKTFCFDQRMMAYHQVRPEAFTVGYCMKRSFKEGWSEPTWSITIDVLCRKVAVVLINPIRYLLTGDFNYICRFVVAIGYILRCLSFGFFRKGLLC